MAAFNSKYLQFTKATATGVQTVTGVGFRGKALLLWTTAQTASGATTSSLMGLGMTDGVLQSVRFINHPGAETPTKSAQGERTDAIAWKTDATGGPTPTIAARGVFVAFTSDGWQINWTTNDANADIYHALVLGGDISAAFKQVKITVNSPDAIDVTGVGFRPSSFIVMGGAADEFGTGDYNRGGPYGSIHGFGFSNATDNVCGWTLGFSTGSASDTYRGQQTDRVSSVRAANVAGAAELMGARITAILDDGFTITRDVGTTTHQPVQHVLCLKGVRVAIGQTTARLTTGSQTITLPFQPDVFMLQSLGTTASANTSEMGMAIGAWQRSGDDAGGTWIGGVDAANPSVYRRATYVDSIIQIRSASAGTVVTEAAVTSSSATGVVLNFTSVSGNADAILYMALAATPTITGSAVFGVNTIVKASRAIAFGLDGEDNVHDTEGQAKVFGDVAITGDLVVDGSIIGAVEGGGGSVSALDIERLSRAQQGLAVYSGCLASEDNTGASMDVDVAAGHVRTATGLGVLVTAGEVTLATADATNPRIDLVWVNTSGTLGKTDGTPAATPEPPNLPADTVLLAIVSVPANDTTIANAQITDKRTYTKLPQIVRKTSDQSVTSSTTYVAATSLTITAAASEVWSVQANLYYTAAQAGDLKTHFSMPSGGVGTDGSHRPAVGVTGTIGDGNWNSQIDFTTPGNSIGGGADASVLFFFKSLLFINSSTPGNVALNFAQDTSNGTATIIRAHSFMMAWPQF